MKHHRRRTQLATLFFAATLAICAYPAHSQSLSSRDKEVLNKILKENEVKQPGEAVIGQVQAIIDKNPKDYYARLVMGNTLDRVGMPVQAVEQYQLAVQYGPNDAKAIIELVKAEIGVGQKEAAMRLLQQADKRFPNDREITFWMGNYHLAKGDLALAEQKFSKVMSSGPAFFGMSTAQAEIQLKLRRYRLAAVMVEKDLKITPDYPLGNAVKGEALFALKEYKQSVPYLAKAYISFPFQQDYAKKLAEACLVTYDYQTALEPAMVALATSSRATEPDKETQWLFTSVVASLPRNFVEEQVPGISERISKQINNARWHFSAGEIFDNSGYHGLAAAQYYKAYQLEPSHPMAAYRLANDLEMYFQKYEEAAFYLKQAHTQSPGNTEIADRLERLQNRLAGRNADLAWQLKDLLQKKPSPI